MFPCVIICIQLVINRIACTWVYCLLQVFLTPITALIVFRLDFLFSSVLSVSLISLILLTLKMGGGNKALQTNLMWFLCYLTYLTSQFQLNMLLFKVSLFLFIFH